MERRNGNLSRNGIYVEWIVGNLKYAGLYGANWTPWYTGGAGDPWVNRISTLIPINDP